MLDKPDSVVPGTIMPRIPMDRSTRDLLVEYLAGRTPSQTARRKSLPEPVARPGGVVARDGASLYARYCAPCHGLRGGGDGPNARFLPVPPARHSSSAVMSQRSDDALFDTIYGGGAVMNRSNLMPPYGATLSGGEIRSLVLHIRKLCGCRGPAWSRRP
jgi:mono/diheme cytochrome c family protein